jgi:hypothetical protein
MTGIPEGAGSGGGSVMLKGPCTGRVAITLTGLELGLLYEVT